jgi:hypothetical protein
MSGLFAFLAHRNPMIRTFVLAVLLLATSPCLSAERQIVIKHDGVEVFCATSGPTAARRMYWPGRADAPDAQQHHLWGGGLGRAPEC